MAGRPAKQLNPRQVAFIRHWISTGNGTQSAIAAGYSSKNAAHTAVELLKNELVIAELEKHQNEVIATGKDERASAVKELDQRIEDARAANQHSAVSSLMQTKMKVKGLWIDKPDKQLAPLTINISTECKRRPPDIIADDPAVSDAASPPTLSAPAAAQLPEGKTEDKDE